MSPPVAEEHDSETLTELLSQLAALYDSVNGTADTDLLTGDHVAPANRRNSKHANMSRQNGRCARSSNMPYSTYLQRRRKAELHALRSEARQLSDHFNYLLSLSSDRTMTGKEVTPSKVQHEQLQWRRQAMVACEERVRAERLNRELKAISIQHFKLFNSVRKVLADSNTLEGVEFVSQPPSNVYRPFFQFNITTLILAELSSNLRRMYLGIDVVTSALGNNLSVSFCTKAKLQDDHKTIIETTSITPLACSMADAGNILWHYVTNRDNSDVKVAFDFNSV